MAVSLPASAEPAPAVVAAVDPIAQATAQVQAFEQESLAASAQATVARASLLQAQQRLADATAEVEQAKSQLVSQQEVLSALARAMYVNGGIVTEAITLALDNPEEFMRSLDRLAVASNTQNSVLRNARTQAYALVAAQAEQEAALADTMTQQQRLDDAARAAAASLTNAQQVLQQLTEEQRQLVAEQVAAAQAAAQAQQAAAAEQAARDAQVQAASQVAATAAPQAAAPPAVAKPVPPAPAPPPSTPKPNPTPPAAPKPTPKPTAPQPAPAPAVPGDDWAESAAWAATPKAQQVIRCESGGNYGINTGNGYYGAWQFDYRSWHGNGGGAFAQYPHQASKAQQDYVAWTYWKKAGWRPWACA